MKEIQKVFGLVLFVVAFTGSHLFAQLVTVDPTFPSDDQSVVITFNAALGSGGLAGYTGDVYAHTGVITDQSTSGSDWKYVVTNWGQNTPETKLTNIGTDLYTLNIGPSIRDYYGVPAGETILQMAFVFRSDVEVGGSWLEGKTDTGGDIFVDVYEPELNVAFILPDESPLLVDLSDQITVEIAATLADTVALYKGDTLIHQAPVNNITTVVTANTTGKTWLIAKAWNATDIKYDSIYYFVKPTVTVQDPPVGTEYGINYLNNQTVLLSLQAPGKDFAFVIGDFNNWELEDDYFMNVDSTGDNFWVEITNLIPGKEYIFQYFVDGELRVADPYTEKTSDPWNDQWIPSGTYPDLLPYPTGKTTGVASVLQTDQAEYTWAVPTFTAPAKKDLIIYELLVRDFTDNRNFQTLLDSLSYLKYLGVNAIELMPVNEFSGNDSWGYNPSFYLAVDKSYGPKNKFKEFIDSCHINGMAVIMDMVWNHADGLNPMCQLYWNSADNIPATDNPWFNAVCPHEPYCWFNDWNHESLYTQAFVDRANSYWLEEFKVDGFRFDYTKGLTNKVGNGDAYDGSRIDIIERMSDVIWSVNPNAYVILEHWCSNTEEKELANYGCMLWGNLTHDFEEAAMGYSSDFNWTYYGNRGWNDPNLVTYMESHDEERMMYKNIQYGASNGSYSTKDLATALDRMELTANFSFPIPGPKMIWQFGELGYDVSIDFNGRVGIKPTHWEYFVNPDRNNLFHVYKALIHLKKNYPVFSTTDLSFDSGTMHKRINLNDPSMNVTILGNFDVQSGDIIGKFQHGGWWYEYYSGDSINITDVNASISFEAGEYRLYTDVKLPPPVLEWFYVGIDEIANSTELTALAYPNPSNSEFHILAGGLKPGNLTIEIFSLSGQKVWQHLGNVLGSRSGNFVWDGKSLSGTPVVPGMYFCRITNGNTISNIRLVKM